MKCAPIAALALAVAGCQSFAISPGPCADYDDQRQWRALAAPPPNARAMQLAADAHPGFQGGWTHRNEFWFATRSGEIMLCRTGDNLTPNMSRDGQSWTFSAQGTLVEGGGMMWLTTR